MKLYITIDQYGTCIPQVAKSPRQAVLIAWSSSKTASIKKQYCDTLKGETNQTGYVLGTGAGNQCSWVSVYEAVNPFEKKEVKT